MVFITIETIYWGFYNVFSIPFPPTLLIWGIYILWGLGIITLLVTEGEKQYILTRELYIGSCCGLVCFAFNLLAISVLVNYNNMHLMLPGTLLIVVLTFISITIGIHLTKRKIYLHSNEDAWNKKWMIPTVIGITLPGLGILIGHIVAPRIFDNIPDEVLDHPWFTFGVFMAISVFVGIRGTMSFYCAYLIRKFKLSNIKIGQT